VAGSGGIYEIQVRDQVVYTKAKGAEFPSEGEIIALLRQCLPKGQG